MENELRIGLIGTASVVVNNTNTAAALGSGYLEVFATPAMIALMEEAACNVLAPYLEVSDSSVGIKINVSHDAASLPQQNITAQAELTAIDGRKLTFAVSAQDENGRIGSGIHERFIINKEKFLAKLQNK